jgi:hypothetical protein
LTAEEGVLADQLYEKFMDLKSVEGLTMCGTQVVSVFLKRRVQPLMPHPHQLWLYTGERDKSRVSLSEFSEEELRDEVRHLTRLSQKDNIILTSARPPLDLKHLPVKVIFLVSASNIIFISRFELDNFPSCRQASTVNQCYAPTPESGVVTEDDDASEETKSGCSDDRCYSPKI